MQSQLMRWFLLCRRDKYQFCVATCVVMVTVDDLALGRELVQFWVCILVSVDDVCNLDPTIRRLLQRRQHPVKQSEPFRDEFHSQHTQADWQDQ